MRYSIKKIGRWHKVYVYGELKGEFRLKSQAIKFAEELESEKLHNKTALDIVEETTPKAIKETTTIEDDKKEPAKTKKAAKSKNKVEK